MTYFRRFLAWLRPPRNTVIHKVEITINSTQPSGEIARYVVEEVRRVTDAKRTQN